MNIPDLVDGSAVVVALFALLVVVGLVVLVRDLIAEERLSRNAEHAALCDEICRLDGQIRDLRAERQDAPEWRAPARVLR